MEVISNQPLIYYTQMRLEEIKIDTNIMVKMIREHLIKNDSRRNEENPWVDLDLSKMWNSYPMSVDGYAVETDKIFIRYKILIGDDPSTQLIRIDKIDYIRRVSNKESYERDKKIEEILRTPSIFEKIRNIF